MLVAAFAQYFFGFTIFLSSLFLILLVLVQRGRGGGLTGALGGPGGQSAFGTKAGDLFTRITIGVAAVWIFLCAAAVYVLKDSGFITPAAANRATMEAVGGAGDVTSGSAAAGSSADAADSTSAAAVENDRSAVGDAPAANSPAAPSAEGSGAAADEAASQP